MLEDQPLDLSVRVGDYAELAREDSNEQDQRERKDLPVDDYGNAAAALRLRGCFVGASATSEYTQEREDRTCSEDSDDSCSDNNQKDESGTRSRSRPPGTKPYKKNLMRRYRESISLDLLPRPAFARDVLLPLSLIRVSIVPRKLFSSPVTRGKLHGILAAGSHVSGYFSFVIGQSRFSGRG